MSTHPNAILAVALKPDGLTRATFRAIQVEMDTSDDDAAFKIGGKSYNVEIMESDYSEDYQISADEGDIVVFDMVTYGYGAVITWDALDTQKRVLDEWAAGICERHKCTRRIFVTANYW
jgi:hypothetical protein